MSSDPAQIGRAAVWLKLIVLAVFALAMGLALYGATIPAMPRIAAQGGGSPTPTTVVTSTPSVSAPAEHTLEIVSVRPHDPAAFTQGLLLHDGRLFESTGRRGSSTVREVDPATGEVLRQKRLAATDFGEGLARVDDRLIQITWQENVAYVWDLETLDPRGLISYSGEGWGLCFDGERLVMTDGGDTLLFRDPETFALLGEIEVTLAGRRLEEVNELECVGDRVWGNVWFEDFIVAIDPDTGVVTDRVDAAPLRARLERDYPSTSINVLNGIAFDPATGHWLLTGKLWPALFEVRFVPGMATATPSATATARPVLLPRLEGRRR